MMLLFDDHDKSPLSRSPCSPTLIGILATASELKYAHRVRLSISLPRRCRGLSRGTSSVPHEIPREKARYVAPLFMNPTNYRC